MTSAFHKARGLALVTVKKEEKEEEEEKKNEEEGFFSSSSWFFFVALSHGQPHTAFGGFISSCGGWWM